MISLGEGFRLGLWVGATLLLAGAGALPSWATGETHVFVMAHADDWQLFMNPAVAQQIDAGHRVVLVHFSAGDAGLKNGTDGRAIPYYLAREQGSVRALHFLSKPPRPQAVPVATPLKVAGHRLVHYQWPQVQAYFLRLPDGNLSGQGYAGTGFQSLLNLQQGLSALDAVDGRQRYARWDALIATLAAIAREQQGTVTLHGLDPDAARNPQDHADHQVTGFALQQVAERLCLPQRLYLGYASAQQPVNLRGKEAQLEAVTWGITAATLAEAGFANPWDQGHNAWLERQYFRNVEAPCQPPRR
jgi:LmbE family N-acetylglucosaminyl deacetylase